MTETSPPQAATKPSPGLDLPSIALIAAVVIFVGVIGWQFARQNAAPPSSGNNAPNFAVTTFDGEEISLDDLAGNVVVVNFWASWCVPCEDEAPILQETWEEYQDENFVLLGITHADIRRDSLEFVDEYGLTYPNAPDPASRIYDEYGLTGVPETFIIAPDGTLAYTLRGPLSDTTTPEFFSTLDELVGGAA